MLRWWRHLSAWSSLALWLCGCSPMPHAADRLTDSLPQTDTFKVLTYNTLHGLQVERFWVRPGEMLDRQLARFHLRVEQLAASEPDVALLQEVNPLPHMAQRY